MLLTWASGVIGCARLTVIGTVLPFSTSGGISSLTLPVLTSAEPTTLRMAEAIIAGVASNGRSVTFGIVPATAAPPARPKIRWRNRRRVDRSWLCIFLFIVLFALRLKKGDNILDLRRRQ